MSRRQRKHPCIIDVHHHYFPPDLDKGRANELACWRAPPGSLPWHADHSIDAMDAAGIDVAILSLPAIPTAICSNEENRAKARQRNLLMKSICLRYPDRFGFFATVPSLHDVKGNCPWKRVGLSSGTTNGEAGALEEIAYAFDELHADGIALASSYGLRSNASQFKLASAVESYL